MSPRDAQSVPVWAYVFRLDIPGCADIVKVGRSIAPWTRIENIRSHTPFDVDVLAIISDGVAAEATLKKMCRSSKIRGEWFRDNATLRVQLSVYEADGRVYRLEKPDSGYMEKVVRPMLRACVAGSTLRIKELAELHLLCNAPRLALPMGGPYPRHFDVLRLSQGRIPIGVTLGILPKNWDGDPLSLLLPPPAARKAA